MPNSPYGRKIRYEQPILTFGAREFLTGIASSAHATVGGLFYKAAGVTALNSPGFSDAVDNGLLRGGPPVTDLSNGVVADMIFGSTKDYGPPGTGAENLYMIGQLGHFYKMQALVFTLSDLRSGTPIPTPSNGIAITQPKGGTKYLYYFSTAAGTQYIGRWDLTGTYPTGWSDTYYSNASLTPGVMKPTHNYFDTILFGNSAGVGSIADDGAGGITITPLALNIQADSYVTAISDDGVYAAIAITNNLSSFLPNARTKVLFWDGSSSSWLREYPVNDPYIVSMKRVGNALICQGANGIYQVSFSGGVKKLISRKTYPQNYVSARAMGPALSGIINQVGYVFGAWLGNFVDASPPNVIATMGSISDGAPNAFSTPILVDTSGNSTITLIETEFDIGKIYAAVYDNVTLIGKLLQYSFGQATAETGVFAQTIYISLPTRYKIHRIDVIFGKPLATGDDFSIQTKLSEAESAVNFAPSITFSLWGAIRRKTLIAPKPVVVDEQISFIFKFNGGAPNVKKIEVYGQLMTP